MKELKIATTFGQSRRLIACGIVPNTADMCWSTRIRRCDGTPIAKKRRTTNLWIGYPCKRTTLGDEEFDNIPAWSLSALLPVLPKMIDGSHWLTIQRCNELYSDYAYGLAYMACDYDDRDDPENWNTHSVGKKCVTHSSNLIEAVVRAIEWLTANGYPLNTPNQ